MSILNNRKKDIKHIDNLKTSKAITEILSGCEISYSELEEKTNYIKSIENEVKRIKKHLDKIDKIENEIQNLKFKLFRLEEEQRKENEEVKREIRSFHHDPQFLLEILLMN